MMDAVDAAVEVVMRTCRGDVGPGGEERRERVLLRPWLENLIHSGLIPGLEWIDVGKTMFKVPWKHRSKKNWSLRHSSVFLVRLSDTFVSHGRGPVWVRESINQCQLLFMVACVRYVIQVH